MFDTVAKSLCESPQRSNSTALIGSTGGPDTTESLTDTAFDILADAAASMSRSDPTKNPRSKRRAVSNTVPNETLSASENQSEQGEYDSSAHLETRNIEINQVDIPQPSSTKCSPDEYLVMLMKAELGIDMEAKHASTLGSFFAEVTEEQMAAYTMNVVGAVRNNDLVLLKTLHKEGQSLDCANRFGETLLNMACRRGFEDVVQYLFEHDINVRICDDGGRTPLHDACWNPTPQLKICQGLIEREPSLLLVADRRGCTAFEYARAEHWDQWREFLFDNRRCLHQLKQPDILAKFAKKCKDI